MSVGRVVHLLGADGDGPVSGILAGWTDRCGPRGIVGEQFGAAEAAVADFSDQFVIDVGAGGADQRAALLGAVPGDEVGDFMLSLFVADYEIRRSQVLSRLIPVAAAQLVVNSEPGDLGPGDRGVQRSLGERLGLFLRTVAKMENLDQVTTELVRLRGARSHHCRLCQSIRSVGAVEAGADETLFGQVDHYESSDLDDRQRTALRLVDATVGRPADMDDETVAAVRRWLSPEEAVEIVYDIVRNSAQKVAVAFGVDDPHVIEGVEYFDIDEEGEVRFGRPVPQGAPGVP